MNSTHKILIIGDRGVGKTSFLHMYLKKDFKINQAPTQGCSISERKYITNNGIHTLEFYDISYNYDNLYENAKACIIMFDITNEKSYDNTFELYYNVTQINPNINVFLCGTKADQASVELCIKRDIDINMDEWGCKDVMYYETTSKKNKGVTLVFNDLLKYLIDPPIQKLKIYPDHIVEEVLMCLPNIENKENNVELTKLIEYVLLRATLNYERFNNLPNNTYNWDDVYRSSYGIQGWFNYNE
jgi:GTPase SAR1 family protein